MGEKPSEVPVPEPTDAGDDALQLRVSRRTGRRLGFAAVLIVVAAAGIGIGLLLAGGDDADTAAPASRRRNTTTSSRATTTTVPAATGDTAAAVGSGSSGATEGAEEAAASDDGAAAEADEPAAEAPAVVPVPGIPTAQLSLAAIPLGCAGDGPTLRVNWSTTNAATASLKVDGANTPILSVNGSLLLDVDCRRAIAVRLTAFGVDHSTAEANSSIVIGP